MSKDRNNKKGFTLAEVLITLTIIGVVAALTIPSLLANVSDKTYDAKRRGLETRLAQAVAQMDNLTSYVAKPPEGSTEDPAEYSVKHSSMNFVVDGLSKVFKITNVCEFDNFSACDFPAQFANWYQNVPKITNNYRKLSNWTSYNSEENFGGKLTEAVALRTKNGESMLLWYNPYCVAEQTVPEGGSKKWHREVCAYMIVDLDGSKKGPNIMGRDIHGGIIMYPDTPYLKLVFTEWHGNTGRNLPSYDDDSTKTMEYYCSSFSEIGFPVGSFRLATRIETYIYSILGWVYDGWTSDIEGAGGDDYGWIIDKEYARLMPRTTTANTAVCQVKEGRS